MPSTPGRRPWAGSVERRARRRATRDLDADDREDFWYHYKSPGLLEANPLGMVPTLVDEGGRVVTESAVCVQFVDELARVRGGSPTSGGRGPVRRRAEPVRRGQGESHGVLGLLPGFGADGG